MEKENQKYSYNDEQVQRVARNLAKYLGDLLSLMTEFMATNEPIRNRILADTKALLEPLPARDRGAVLSAIVVETQQVFAAAGSRKVGMSGDCVGAPGAGVSVTEGNVTVKGCVVGDFESGPRGGGAEVTVSY